MSIALLQQKFEFFKHANLLFRRQMVVSWARGLHNNMKPRGWHGRHDNSDWRHSRRFYGSVIISRSCVAKAEATIVNFLPQDDTLQCKLLTCGDTVYFRLWHTLLPHPCHRVIFGRNRHIKENIGMPEPCSTWFLYFEVFLALGWLATRR